MRFCDLAIVDPKTGQILSIADPKGKTPLHFSSYPNGIGGLPDAGALNIRFDCFMYSADKPMGGSTISVDGIDPNFLRQAHNFTGKAIILRAGMGPG
ncbi:MAG: hypothetical protein ACREFZ_10220, partial [Acetobacteraceae bacterium]